MSLWLVLEPLKMLDVIFTAGRILPTPGVSDYAAQDLEGQTVGDAVPFTYSERNGVVTLGLCFIYAGILPPPLFFGYGDDDLESYPVGDISKLTNSFFTGDVKLATGFVYPSQP